MWELAALGADLVRRACVCACAFVCSRVCSSQTGIIRKYHIFMCRQCFRDQAELIGFRKVRLAVPRPLDHLSGAHTLLHMPGRELGRDQRTLAPFPLDEAHGEGKGESRSLRREGGAQTERGQLAQRNTLAVLTSAPRFVLSAQYR